MNRKTVILQKSELEDILKKHYRCESVVSENFITGYGLKIIIEEKQSKESEWFIYAYNLTSFLIKIYGKDCIETMGTKGYEGILTVNQFKCYKGIILTDKNCEDLSEIFGLPYHTLRNFFPEK